MQGKKRYLVVALFLLIGLTTFSFAAPKEELKEKKTISGTSEKVTNDKKVNNSYTDALEAVEEAEENPTLETVETARTEVQRADDATVQQREELQNRIEVVEESIDVAALVTELETLVTVKETIPTAEDKYPAVETALDEMDEGDVKDNLETRLTRVANIINDGDKPEYSGIQNNQVTKDDVTLVVTDKTEVTKTVKLNNEDVKFEEPFKKEGLYVVTLRDEAFNEETVTFTIDKTAPNFVDLKSGNHYETITVAVDDQTATITVLNNDTKETNEVTNGTVLTKDATYKLTVKDAAGNTKSIWVAIDTTKPTITGVTNGSVVNKSENIYVNDKFLTNVKITGPNSKGEVVTKEFTRSDFTVGANNENFSFKYKANYEGTWTVVATDKAGNTRTETFTIDKTAAKKNAVNANVNGYKNEVKEQYATNGNTVTAYISVNEELKHNPTFTFYTNGKEVKVVGKEEVTASVRESGDYPYVYTAKLVINEELVAEDGTITFKVTDIYDKAGNQTADITKMSVGNKTLTLDRTPNRITFTTISTDNKTVDGKVYYVTDGDTVTFRMGVREKFSVNPVVTIAGKPVELTYVKYYEQPNHHEYKGTLKLDDTLTDGILEITISNLTDEVGNKGFYYQTNGKKVLETVTKKETTNGKSLVYDNTDPVLSYVAMLSKADKYKYAKNGDTIRFLVAYNEPIELNDNFVVTFNNKTKKLVRSGDKTKYEYIAEFKIPEDEKDLAEGLLTFEVKGAQDKLGNEAVSTTTANHYKYNGVTYDRTAPVFVEETGYNENGINPYIKLADKNDISFKVYRKGTETPIHEFSSTTVGKSFKIGWHGGGFYTIVATDAAGNTTSKEFEVYHVIDSIEDLKNAFKNGGQATLAEDITITEPIVIPEGVELVIDLNDKELKATPADGEQFIINKGKLTIKNGEINNDNAAAGSLIENTKTGELVLEDITTLDKATAAGAIIANDGKLTITDSNLKLSEKKIGRNVITNRGDLNISGTKITSQATKGYAITMYEGNLKIDDSNLDILSEGRGGIWIVGGKLTIDNAKINVAAGGTSYRTLYISDHDDGKDIDVTINNGEFTGYRDGIYVGHYDNFDIKLTINDGIFDINPGKNGNILNVEKAKENSENKLNISIKGGTYKNKNRGKVDTYIAEGYRLNSENKVVKENAISTQAEMVSAISEGGKFELDTDLTLTDTSLKVAKNKDVEINLNGKTITARSTTSSASNAIEVLAGGNLKLTGNGKIEFTAGSPDTDWGEGGSKPYPGYASNTIVNRGTLVIDGPTIVNNTEYGGATYAVDAYAGSKLTLISGEISAPYNRAIRMFTSSETPSTDVTIKGGKVTGNIPLYVHVAGSNSSVAPTVNLNISGGEIGTIDGWSLYTYSYGNSFKNINVTITGGEFYGSVAFSGGKKVDKENVSIAGGTFHSDLGRYLANDGWEDITKPTK